MGEEETERESNKGERGIPDGITMTAAHTPPGVRGFDHVDIDDIIDRGHGEIMSIRRVLYVSDFAAPIRHLKHEARIMLQALAHSTCVQNDHTPLREPHCKMLIQSQIVVDSAACMSKLDAGIERMMRGIPEA